MGIWDDLSKTITNAANVTAQKTKDIADLSKLSLSLNSKESSLTDLYTEIGKALVEDFSEQAPAELAEKLQQAEAIKQEMSDIRKKILVLKNIAVCPECATENELAAKFCINCGTKLAEPVAQAVLVDEEENVFEVVEDKIEEIIEKAEEKLDAVFDKDDVVEDAVEAVQEEVLEEKTEE
ncbi:MAG: zinc ribbon domain-containing protein [Firmicutes bacterium]|nr:zinc ribbon domain-containing protein [Bacillota bacterium]